MDDGQTAPPISSLVVLINMWLVDSNWNPCSFILGHVRLFKRGPASLNLNKKIPGGQRQTLTLNNASIGVFQWYNAQL